jgi:hypothetical protein
MKSTVVTAGHELKQAQPEPSLFERLSKAIHNNNRREVAKLLSPEVLDQVNQSGRNIVHLAAEYSDSTCFALICQYVVKQKKESLFMSTDEMGITPLHLANGCNSASVVKYFIETLGANAPEASTMVTDDGVLPIAFLKNNKCKPTDRIAIKKMMEDIMQRNHLCEMHDEVDEKAILAEYKKEIEADPELKSDLIHMVTVLNTKSHIKYSATHLKSPIPRDEKNPKLKPVLKGKIEDMREACNEGEAKIRESFETVVHKLSKKTFNDEVIREYIEADAIRWEAIVDYTAAMTKSEKIGNCYEMAVDVVKDSREANSKKYIQAYKIKNGDHIFGGINRSFVTDSRKPSARMVFGDKWSKTIGLSTDYHVKFKYFDTYCDIDTGKEAFNIVGRMNPKYHRLVQHRYLDQQYASATNFKLVSNLGPTNRRRFYQAQDDQGKTEVHYIAAFRDLLGIKIVFKTIRDLKDEKYTQTTLLLSDDACNLPLHSVASNAQFGAVRFFLDEYKKHFAGELPTLLFGADFKKQNFLRNACAAQNESAITQLLIFFKDNTRITDHICKQLREIMYDLLSKEDDESCKAVQVFLGFPELLGKDDIRKLQQQFLVTKINHPMHVTLWKLCAAQCTADEKEQMLLKHAEHSQTILRFRRLKKIKLKVMTETSSPVGAGFFKLESRSQQRMKLVLQDLPDELEFDEDLTPNISKRKLKDMEYKLRHIPKRTLAPIAVTSLSIMPPTPTVAS